MLLLLPDSCLEHIVRPSQIKQCANVVLKFNHIYPHVSVDVLVEGNNIHLFFSPLPKW